MTLVYDSAASGDIWDKMVPLGVEWGNDPEATSADMPLRENWINPKAPQYSTQTLGWGGRLSGPNDGARNNIAVNGVVMKNEPDSGCISCHSTAQWNVKEHKNGFVPSAVVRHREPAGLPNLRRHRPTPPAPTFARPRQVQPLG